MKIAGISRKETYSPNHITNDAQIIVKTAEILRKLGHEVTIYDEGFIETNDISEELIFSMAQGLAGIKRVQEFESRGAAVVNTPSSALNTYRIQMTYLLTNADIPFPKSLVLDITNRDVDYFRLFNAKQLWLKRGDVHAEHKEDVTLISSLPELQSTLRDFERRGIYEAVIQEHLPGSTIKYYGIQGTGFFHWYFTSGNQNIKFDQNELKSLAFLSAEVLGVEIFGGDVIVSPDGSMSVIDVNDWPSFAPVRDDAAKNIAQLIHKKALENVYQY
ncbi:MAG: hypothetical protein HF314_07570 [Ignavibacteria bacterium]|nr:hypothetical protein [Ignavibacteria bacterium]MCU7502915.1 hypothetical protein [Ignavibacteria bacterium]MCU7515591.1 hypothetical protein [Ignavibacteria bacterium]